MAKSLRSKSKRSFRSKKREEGVYAAAAAGRLHRLNAKLLEITTKPPGSAEEGQDEPGWCWFATFGLLDPNDLTLDSLESFATGCRTFGRTDASPAGILNRFDDLSEDFFLPRFFCNRG